MKGNPRSADLAEMLRRGRTHYTNKNHSIDLLYGLRDPDTLLCHGCPLSLACLSGQRNDAHILHSVPVYPCETADSLVKFTYHISVCFTVDLTNKRVTDHGMYGFSVSTSRAIRQYLDAARENFPELRLDKYPDTMLTLIRKDKGWLNVG